ncbi:4Fe-4S binding protein [Candidatus Bathyarchaeota archaeon]|nr:4Fe-4S binding protein [Candidatus Bathyarchaeota archaeon]
MNLGKLIRLSRIIDPSDGRGLVVAADHGLMLGPIKGVIDLEVTLRKVIAGRPDAILVSPGQARRLSHLFMGRETPAMLVRIDWTNAFRDKTYTLPARSIQFNRVTTVEEAVKIGASGVVTYLFLGFDREEEHIAMVEEFSIECKTWSMPLIIEPLPMGPRVTKTNYVDMVKRAVGKAVELGADALKVPYTGDPYSFKDVIEASSGVPVLVLGGYKALSIRDSLEVISEVLDAGAAGVVFGRNIVQDPNPDEAVRLMRRIIHGKETVTDILREKIKPPVRILVDAEKCSGCHICEFACSLIHEKVFDFSLARLRVETSEDGRMFTPYVCTLCYSCVNACPNGALKVNGKTGAVEVSLELCQGCGVCVNVCPARVLKLVNGKILSCNLCDGLPECAKWCSRNALRVEGGW